MNRFIKDEYLFCACIGGFAVHSASFLLMSMPWSGPLPGIMFWLGLAVGIVSQVLLCKGYKKYLRKRREKKRGKRKNELSGTVPHKRPGIFHFFSNREAKIADVVLAGALLGTLMSVLVTRGVGYVCYVFISISVFSFCMHCIVNGSVYLYVKDLILQKKKSK